MNMKVSDPYEYKTFTGSFACIEIDINIYGYFLLPL